ncbi:MAG: hypothetical protein KDC98_04225, partial [Planctomycetes bacterium]|nr:hypothetical protein [Planctomycetota bacterium]
YAAIVAAEQHVRDARQQNAIAAYTDSIERFGRSAEANPDYADSANHFAVLALAGRALELHGSGDDSAAVADLRRALELRPGSLGDRDGLKRRPREIAGLIRKALAAQGRDDLADQLADIAR